ncbi:MAG: hypothetical protein WDW38_010996 [Sanguina aurantia]
MSHTLKSSDFTSRQEELLRRSQVSNAEAERLFKTQLLQLSTVLTATKDSLSQLTREHGALKDDSHSEMDGLRLRAETLQRTCDDMERAKALMQQALGSASLRASHRDAAQARVAELEAGIAGVQAAASSIIQQLGEKRWGG